MFIYLLSSGEYSDYTVSGVAIRDDELSLETLKALESEFQTINGKKDLDAFLSQHGFVITYDFGEIRETGRWPGEVTFYSGREPDPPDAFREHMG